MTIKQISVFIEDKAGSVEKVLNVLKEGGHQILTSMLSDSPEFAIYRILCTDTEGAYMHLRAAGCNVMLTNVLALQVDDEPGAAAKVLHVLSEAGISIKYLYSFLLGGKGILVLRTNQVEKAEETLILNHIQTATEADLDALIKGIA